MNGCGSRFAQQGVLNGHIRPRKRQKPCSCKYPGCGKRFRHSWNRNWRPRLSNNETLPCDIDECLQRLLQWKTLQDHQQESYKQGKTPNRTDNCSLDSFNGQPSATPQLTPMTSAPHDPDYMDVDSQDDSVNWLRYLADLLVQFQGRHMHKHHDKRREIPTSVPGNYHGISKQTQQVLQEEPVPAQDQLSQRFQQLCINPVRSIRHCYSSPQPMDS